MGYKIGCTTGKDEIVFHLRSISVAEENKYTARYIEIEESDSEEKKADQEYVILTDALANWSDQVPTIKVDGIEAEVKVDAVPAEVVRAYFAEKTPEKERVAQRVVLGFRNKLQPKVVFY